MSFETVRIISGAEAEAEELRTKATAKCKETVAAAQAAAEQIIDKARNDAEEEAAKARKAEEEKLTVELKDIVDSTEEQKNEIRTRAESRMNMAVTLIAGRIVNV